MQLAVEIKLLCLTLRISDAVPKAANLLDPEGAGLNIARVGNEPVVEFAMEGRVSLVSRATADRVGGLATARGSGRGRPATIESIRAPTPSKPGARRTSASRIDPLARLAAAARASRLASLHGGPTPITAWTVPSSDRGSSRKRRRSERIVGRTWPGRCEMIRISEPCDGS